VAILLAAAGGAPACNRGIDWNGVDGHGPCVTTFTRFVSDAGIPGRGEACGEILLRVDWDLDRDGTWDCRVKQFTADEGVYVRSSGGWSRAPPDSGCPPE